MKSLAILLPLILLSEPAAAAATPPAAPVAKSDGAASRAVVEALHEVLIGCMKEADALGFQGRYERISAGLGDTFDLPFMARLSVGAAWKQLTPEQRVDFVDLSRRLSASKYAHNFDGYAGQRFETLSDQPAARGTIVVKTELVQPSDENVKFDYRLRQSAQGWRIIDVQLDGKVSEITLRRADYRSVIKRQGFPKLVEALEKKIAKLAKP